VRKRDYISVFKVVLAPGIGKATWQKMLLICLSICVSVGNIL